MLLDPPFDRAAVEGCLDLAAPGLDLELADVGAGDLGLGLGQLHLGLADRAQAVEPVVDPRRHLRRVQLGARGVELRLIAGAIEGDQHVAGLEALPGIDAEAGDAAGNLGRQHGVPPRLDQGTDLPLGRVLGDGRPGPEQDGSELDGGELDDGGERRRRQRAGHKAARLAGTRPSWAETVRTLHSCCLPLTS